MKSEKVLKAMALPEGCLISQRIPKTVLAEHAAASPTDKRLIKNTIESLKWIAALKPDNIGVPPFKDRHREYLEISILVVVFREKKGANRLIELIHKAIPYPVFLLVEYSPELFISLAHKRWAQKEKGRMVIEEGFPQNTLVSENAPEAFFDHLALSRLPHLHMMALYSGWLNAATALDAFYLTGRFKLAKELDEASKQKILLEKTKEIEKEISKTRRLAEKESQINRRVQLNLKLKALKTRRNELLEKLV